MQMSLLNHLLTRLGLRRRSRPSLDEHTYQSMLELARLEQRPLEELHAGLLAEALDRRSQAYQLQADWQRLSLREQQVAALACLGYTNPQIAARLSISGETVKTHMRNVLLKFNLASKAELRAALAHWDFSDWQD